MSSRIGLILATICCTTQAARRLRQGAVQTVNFDFSWSSADDRQASWSQTFETNVTPAIAIDDPLVLLGPIDAGTHLLTEVMLKNFPEETVRRCKPSQRGCAGVWKHSVDYDGIMAQLEEFIGKDLSRTAIVAIVRSPIALVSSWAKDPWDMADCVRDSLQHLGEPCCAKIGAARPQDHIRTADNLSPEISFRSTMDVYNTYLHTYHRLRKSGRFQHVHLVRYEDLLLAPVRTTRRLAKGLGWPKPKQVYIAENPAKIGGHSSGRYRSMLRLSKRDYLQNVPPAGMDALCKDPPSPFIDEARRRKLVVEDAMGLEIQSVGSYWEDCDSWNSATRHAGRNMSTV